MIEYWRLLGRMSTDSTFRGELCTIHSSAHEAIERAREQQPNPNHSRRHHIPVEIWTHLTASFCLSRWEQGEVNRLCHQDQITGEGGFMAVIARRVAGLAKKHPGFHLDDSALIAIGATFFDEPLLEAFLAAEGEGEIAAVIEKNGLRTVSATALSSLAAVFGDPVIATNIQKTDWEGWRRPIDSPCAPAITHTPFYEHIVEVGDFERLINRRRQELSA